MRAYLAGFFLSFSLIVAIGAQNAFILKQGLRREHVFVLCLICALSDAVLINAGVLGFAELSAHVQAIDYIARYGGALFLLLYGFKSMRAALYSNAALGESMQTGRSCRNAVLLCLAFTWLNPHVYLDTVVLLGSISRQYADHTVLFALGASSASFIFFFALGYGARLLAPIFKRPRAWKILDFLIALLMWGMAAGLLLG